MVKQHSHKTASYRKSLMSTPASEQDIQEKIRMFTNGETQTINGTIRELSDVIDNALKDDENDYNIKIMGENYGFPTKGLLKDRFDMNDGDVMLDGIKAYSNIKIKITRCPIETGCAIMGGRKRTFKSKSRRNLKRRKTRKHRR